MKQRSRKLVSVLLALMMVLSLAVVPAFAAPTSGECGDNLTWNYDESTGTLTISGTGAMWEYTRDAETAYDMSPAPWAELCYDKAQKIVIEEGVTHISTDVFNIFQHVKEVSLPSTLVSIGDGAFWANESLLEIWIPPSVKSIGRNNFGYAYHWEFGEAPLNGFTIYGYSGTEAERYYNELLEDYNRVKTEWMEDMERYGGGFADYADNFGPDGTVYFVDLGEAPEVDPDPAPQDAPQSIDINDLPERKQLEALLYEMGQYWSYLFDPDEESYDCRVIAEYGLFEIITCLSGLAGSLWETNGGIEPWDFNWNIYPGKSMEWGASPYIYRTDKIRVDWVMRNILNCSETDLDVMKTAAFTGQNGFAGGQPSVYEADGFYYGAQISDGHEAWWDDPQVLSAKYDGGYYYVRYIVNRDYDGFLTYYATLSLKTIDGKQYWSIYANSPTEFIYFDTPVQDTPSTPEQPSTGFSDVADTAWYAGDVADIQKYGLINGHPDGTFRPQEKLTLAQAITLAARTHAQLSDKGDIQNGSPWYQPYVDYAAENGLCSVGEFGTDYNSECSRLAMAVLFQRAFPTDTEQNLNTVTTLPDVEDEGYGTSVFYLYRQGVLTGNDGAGTFKPDKSISRAEAAAILNRVMDKDKRKSFTLETASVEQAQ